MKINLKAITASALVLILLIGLITACKKSNSTSNDSNNTPAANLSANGAASDNAFDDAFGIAIQTGNDQNLTSIMQKRDGRSTMSESPIVLGNPYYCANITASGSTFPVTLTVDFGTGCKSSDSIVRSGSITLLYSGKMSLPGTSITATFNNYTVNGYKLTGTYVITNTSSLSTGTFSMTTSVSNGTVTTPSDTTYSFSGSKTVTLVSGTITTPSSLVFNISGGYNISSSFGSSLVATVTTPLVRKQTCPNIVSGITSFVYTNGSISLNGNINYGNGTCDNQAVITVGSFTETITLP